MTYISNTARVSSLTIAGVDYTSNFVSWVVSDESANKNGCIITSGTLTIGTKPGGFVIEDYDRNNFRRGDLVQLMVTVPSSGSSVMHPRGYLYVVSTSYDPEAEQLNLELTCRLGLMSLNDKFDELEALIPIPLDVAQTSFENCCASFSANSQYIYQDNTGNLTTGFYFDDSDGIGWVSILGLTTNSVSPLTASGAIPDKIKLSYQVPQGSLNTDQRGRVDTVETTSYFFFNYPAVSYERINSDASADNPNGTLDNVSNVTSTAPPEASSGSCGNTPPPPSGEGGSGSSCNEGYALVQVPVYVPATRVQTVISKYDGPGAQLSSAEGTIVGPRVEANGQYFADDFAYCRQTWGDQCNPNGTCEKKGLDNIVLGKTITTNEFGDANEVIRTIVDNYATVLSAAQPSDWRAGNANGRIQGFDFGYALNEQLYRQSRVITEYSVEQNVNVQTTTTFSSLTTRGVGVTAGQSLDALDGIETKVVRRSSSIGALQESPDILNSPTTVTETRSTDVLLMPNGYNPDVSVAGPFVIEESLPVPILSDDATVIQDTVDRYSEYVANMIQGDSYGLQVGESLREEVTLGWKPNMQLRYYDASKGLLMALRMDATSWGLNDTGAYMVTDGIWLGYSDGGVVIPSNVQGNSSPDMSGGNSPTPPPPTVPPSIVDESYVSPGTKAWAVNVFLNFSSGATATTADGVRQPAPAPSTRSSFSTTTCYVSGAIVGPGEVLAVNPDGSIPLEYNGGLIVAGATIVDADLFSDDD